MPKGRSGYRSDWPLPREILFQPTRGTTQMRVVTSLWNQYGISAVVPRADVIRGETSGGVAKYRLFSQADFLNMIFDNRL